MDQVTMSLLQTFITGSHTRPSLAVLQSTQAQTALPILRLYLSTSPTENRRPRHKVLFTLRYDPSNLIDASSTKEVEVYDWIDNVPGFSVDNFHPGKHLISTLAQCA